MTLARDSGEVVESATRFGEAGKSVSWQRDKPNGVHLMAHTGCHFWRAAVYAPDWTNQYMSACIFPTAAEALAAAWGWSERDAQ